MDQHFLTPLFAPSSIAVFAGNAELRASDPAYRDAAFLFDALTAQQYSGKFTFLDVDTTEGRLADLISTGADLAIVALPPNGSKPPSKWQAASAAAPPWSFPPASAPSRRSSSMPWPIGMTCS